MATISWQIREGGGSTVQDMCSISLTALQCGGISHLQYGYSVLPECCKDYNVSTSRVSLMPVEHDKHVRDYFEQNIHVCRFTKM